MSHGKHIHFPDGFVASEEEETREVVPAVSRSVRDSLTVLVEKADDSVVVEYNHSTKAATIKTAAPHPIECNLAEDLGFHSNKEKQNNISSSQRLLTDNIQSFRSRSSRKSAKTTDDSTGRSSRCRRFR